MSVQKQIDRLIALQAAEWFEALKGGDADVNEGFMRWAAESPRHMEAFLMIASEAPVLRAVLAAGQFDLGALLKKVSPQLASLPTAVTRSRNPHHHKTRQWRRWSVPAAAAAGALAIAVALHFNSSSWQRFETPVGEQRAIQLTEGSIVSLNARSRVDVRFSESQRDLRLLHGEATFKVAPDRKRPFRVYTPNAVVEALGTQFNVYARPDGTTTVSVLEGKVKVSSDRPVDVRHQAAPAALTVGQEVKVAASGDILHPVHTDVIGAVAWQQRKLVFKRSALEDMAMEFNRYNKSMQIRLEDIEPGSFRFTGAFDADDPLSLAELLKREPGLAVERRDGEIVIHRSR